MTDDTQPGPSSVETGGGAYIQGSASTGGGDFVNRDKIVNQYVQVDLAKVLDALKQALPAGDPAGQQLVAVLRGFQELHILLRAWKELHNGLNDVTNALDQFTHEVERLDVSQTAPDARRLSRLWRPIRQKVQIVLDDAACASPIVPTPFAIQPEGVQGPAWAVELHAGASRIETLLDLKSPDSMELYDAAFDFDDAVDRHMYLADKHLRETASELYNLSAVVLRSLSHDNP